MGALFRFVYLNPVLEQKCIPPVSEVTYDDASQWLSRRNAYAVSYDDRFNWRDISAEYRKAATDKVLRQMLGMFQANDAKDTPYFLAPMMPALASNAVALAQYAAGMEAQGNKAEAVRYQQLSDNAVKDNAANYLARAKFYFDAGYTSRACGDLRALQAISPGDAGVTPNMQQACR